MTDRTIRLLTDIIMAVAVVAAAAVSAALTIRVFALIGVDVDWWEAFTLAVISVLVADDVRLD